METNHRFNNIVRNFLENREYSFITYPSSEELRENTVLAKDEMIISENDTLDGLKLTITVQTLLINGRAVAQDFIIKDRRGNAPIHATVNDVMDKLRMYL